MTSTLQQEASRKLRFSAQQTMRVAQRLYENGYITYMRTDSTSLSESAIAAARDQARELYGADAVPAEPRQYNRRVKNARPGRGFRNNADACDHQRCPRATPRPAMSAQTNTPNDL